MHGHAWAASSLTGSRQSRRLLLFGFDRRPGRIPVAVRDLLGLCDRSVGAVRLDAERELTGRPDGETRHQVVSGWSPSGGNAIAPCWRASCTSWSRVVSLALTSTAAIGPASRWA